VCIGGDDAYRVAVVGVSAACVAVVNALVADVVEVVVAVVRGVVSAVVVKAVVRAVVDLETELEVELLRAVPVLLVTTHDQTVDLFHLALHIASESRARSDHCINGPLLTRSALLVVRARWSPLK
jgi:pyruvate-formate lyase-activating enzyme